MVGLLLLLVAMDSYLVTGSNLGWPSLSTYAIYAGFPVAEIALFVLFSSGQLGNYEPPWSPSGAWT